VHLVRVRVRVRVRVGVRVRVRVRVRAKVSMASCTEPPMTPECMSRSEHLTSRKK
tara:strand:+ start:389 stop:553 length:165 start_codon:yes stop_codon:yes gene_type:complete